MFKRHNQHLDGIIVIQEGTKKRATAFKKEKEAKVPEEAALRLRGA